MSDTKPYKTCLSLAEAVFTGDSHPRFDHVFVSGGEDDQAYVWQKGEADPNNVVFKTSFKDSVVFARYDVTSTFLNFSAMLTLFRKLGSILPQKSGTNTHRWLMAQMKA